MKVSLMGVLDGEGTPEQIKRSFVRKRVLTIAVSMNLSQTPQRAVAELPSKKGEKLGAWIPGRNEKPKKEGRRKGDTACQKNSWLKDTGVGSCGKRGLVKASPCWEHRGTNT